MKYITLFVAALVAAALIGCGGDGNDHSATTGGTEGTNQPRIEAVVRIERTNLEDPSKYSDDDLRDPTKVDPKDLIEETVYGVQDTNNFQANESYYFQLVAYTSSGRRVILPASFITDDVSFTHGVVGDSGLYLASNVPTGEPVYVSATYNGERFTTTYQLKERQVRLLGSVKTEGTNAAIPGVRVDFFDGAGLSVGSVVSGYNGTFRASIPAGARSYTVNSQALPTKYFASYKANGVRYNAGDVDCRTPITYDATGTYDLPTIFVTPRVDGAPTPTPDGCGG